MENRSVTSEFNVALTALITNLLETLLDVVRKVEVWKIKTC